MKDNPESAATAVARPVPGEHDHDDLFIAGTWRPARGSGQVAVHDSGTEAQLGRIRSASTADVDDAVAAAKAARAAWAATAPEARARLLDGLNDELERRSSLLTGFISAEVGTAVRLCPAIQVASGIEIAANMAALAREYRFEEQVGNSTVVHQPVGVVAAITPWNYPLFQAMAKVAAALAAGSTVVHKPSGLAPLSAFVLAEAVEAAGFPPGVYNLVAGPGAEVGEALAAHAGIDLVSFTGSTSAGTIVYQRAAASIKRVTLELGGKSASVLLDDADLPVAVKATVNRAFLNSGQTCDAWTRLLVPRGRLDEVVDLAVASAERLPVGDPFDERTRLGPLVSADQVARVRGYVDGALAEGAIAALGGSAPPPGFERGHYVAPTILTGVTPDMTVANEEVFGPVLSIIAYDGEDAAVEIANGTEYGLSGAVWSMDPARAESVARRIEAGQVVINGGRFNPLAPVGGMKRSGLGRELGRAGLEEFLEPKSLQA
jgi:betaine-aldehyde dehydrogenase